VSYLVTGRAELDRAALDSRAIVAQGDAMVFEGPWPWDAPIVARIEDAKIESLRGLNGYAVDGLAEPDDGQAFVVAATSPRSSPMRSRSARSCSASEDASSRVRPRRPCWAAISSRTAP
jgi:hypothetical protein